MFWSKPPPSWQASNVDALHWSTSKPSVAVGSLGSVPGTRSRESVHVANTAPGTAETYR